MVSTIRSPGRSGRGYTCDCAAECSDGRANLYTVSHRGVRMLSFSHRQSLFVLGSECGMGRLEETREVTRILSTCRFGRVRGRSWRRAQNGLGGRISTTWTAPEELATTCVVGIPTHNCIDYPGLAMFSTKTKPKDLFRLGGSCARSFVRGGAASLAALVPVVLDARASPTFPLGLYATTHRRSWIGGGFPMASRPCSSVNPKRWTPPSRLFGGSEGFRT